ncbi:MAG: hypothetical protein KDA80_22980 [Planctomycetaceae bacterium]|nr:hypothetical protein [Planctomycetaceae bacterium]
MGRVRSRVAEHTWGAFDLTELQGIPAMDIAAQLEMNVDQATYGLADLGPDDLLLTRGVRGLEAPDTALVF